MTMEGWTPVIGLVPALTGPAPQNKHHSNPISLRDSSPFRRRPIQFTPLELLERNRGASATTTDLVPRNATPKSGVGFHRDSS
jgi:hypothetical protein